MCGEKMGVFRESDFPKSRVVSWLQFMSVCWR
nr:MAG TPA: hypothetical protein [Caudoviricetes sp.]